MTGYSEPTVNGKGEIVIYNYLPEMPSAKEAEENGINIGIGTTAPDSKFKTKTV